MRLLSWSEFAKCEAGTVFQIMRHGHGLGELLILGDIVFIDGEPRDFIYASLTPELQDRDSFGASADSILPADSDAPMFVVMPSLYGRDGLFEYDNRSWLVWDEEDRQRLAGWLTDVDKARKDQNDDPAVLLPVTLKQGYLP